MDGTPLIAHSRAEARMFFRATPCPLCGTGLLKALDTSELGKVGSPTVQARARCEACHETSEFLFRFPAESRTDSSRELEIINPTEEPSRIIDVSQWITLYAVLHEEAGRESERFRKRRLELEAGQCLDEALKFFDDEENDVPPPSAFFQDSARDRFRDQPQEFSRQRLINFRAALPKSVVVREPRPD